MSMTNPADRVEIITSVQRRRRWTASEKVRIVEETFEPGMTVSLVARRHGVAPNQLFTWRRLVAQGALTAAGSGAQRRLTLACIAVLLIVAAVMAILFKDRASPSRARRIGARLVRGYRSRVD